MRHVILLDKKITDYETWREQDIKFWQRYLNITPEYKVIPYDFSDYPTYVDSDGDIRITRGYLQHLADMVYKWEGDHGTDFVIIAIHEDNWKSDPLGDKGKGIWGTNYSYVFNNYMMEYCRWDKDNVANTFGTIYHERMHSFDAIVNVELGENANSIVGIKDWDKEVVHGQSDTYKYIRYKENIEAVYKLAPYLRQAFAVRKQKHEDYINGLKKKISLLEQLLYLYRKWRNLKNGNPR